MFKPTRIISLVVLFTFFTTSLTPFSYAAVNNQLQLASVLTSPHLKALAFDELVDSATVAQTLTIKDKYIVAQAITDEEAAMAHGQDLEIIFGRIYVKLFNFFQDPEQVQTAVNGNGQFEVQKITLDRQFGQDYYRIDTQIAGKKYLTVITKDLATGKYRLVTDYVVEFRDGADLNTAELQAIGDANGETGSIVAARAIIDLILEGQPLNLDETFRQKLAEKFKGQIGADLKGFIDRQIYLGYPQLVQGFVEVIDELVQDHVYVYGYVQGLLETPGPIYPQIGAKIRAIQAAHPGDLERQKAVLTDWWDTEGAGVLAGVDPTLTNKLKLKMLAKLLRIRLIGTNGLNILPGGSTVFVKEINGGRAYLYLRKRTVVGLLEDRHRGLTKTMVLKPKISVVPQLSEGEMVRDFCRCAVDASRDEAELQALLAGLRRSPVIRLAEVAVETTAENKVYRFIITTAQKEYRYDIVESPETILGDQLSLILADQAFDEAQIAAKLRAAVTQEITEFNFSKEADIYTFNINGKYQIRIKRTGNAQPTIHF